jgi:hypothetical protein
MLVQFLSIIMLVPILYLLLIILSIFGIILINFFEKMMIPYEMLFFLIACFLFLLFIFNILVSNLRFRRVI